MKKQFIFIAIALLATIAPIFSADRRITQLIPETAETSQPRDISEGWTDFGKEFVSMTDDFNIDQQLKRQKHADDLKQSVKNALWAPVAALGSPADRTFDTWNAKVIANEILVRKDVTKQLQEIKDSNLTPTIRDQRVNSLAQKYAGQHTSNVAFTDSAHKKQFDAILQDILKSRFSTAVQQTSK